MQNNLTYYSTFGSPMPTRQWSDPNSKYKYGFNGKEKNNDLTVDGGEYDFGARIYDSIQRDKLADKVKQAKELIDFCENKL